jgi:transcriptional regulator with XRE-family HTH domain
VPPAPVSSLRLVFASRVRARRRVLALSQEQLADRAEVHRTYISQVERGIVNLAIDNIGRIAAALEIEPSELLRRE